MIEVQTIRRELTGVAADASIVGLFEDQGVAPAALAGTPAGALVARLAQAKEIGAAPGDVTVLHGDWGLLAVAGLGPRAKLDAGSAFAAGVAASKKLAARPRGPVAAAFPETDDRAVASAWVEGLVVGTRGPGLRKGEASRHPFESLLLVAAPAATLPDADLAKAAARGRIVGEAVNLARDLANTPPAEKPPAALARRAEAAAAEAGVEAEVWGRDRIAAERFGGVIGVSAGSEHPPAFVHLRYRKGGDAPATALVGKGVTFDSGGLSLKPSASMEDMKADMTGSAVVLAAVCAVAKLGLPVNLDGYMVLTENMTGGAAMKLGDVLTMRNGKTVEVLNTDAEGRLILADALSYAAEQGPARILDLATLTGACLVALGPEDRRPLRHRRRLRRRGPRRLPGDRRARLAAADGRRLQGPVEEPRRGPQEHRRQVRRLDHRGQVPPAVRRRRPLGPPRHRRAELGRRRLAHPRRRRHRLLRPDARGPDRGVGLTATGPCGPRASVRRRSDLRDGPARRGAGVSRQYRRGAGSRPVIPGSGRVPRLPAQPASVSRYSSWHSIRLLLMSSASRISSTSSIGRSSSIAQFRTSRFSWPTLRR